jgi:hypothetical protein
VVSYILVSTKDSYIARASGKTTQEVSQPQADSQHQLGGRSEGNCVFEKINTKSSGLPSSDHRQVAMGSACSSHSSKLASEPDHPPPSATTNTTLHAAISPTSRPGETETARGHGQYSGSLSLQDKESKEMAKPTHGTEKVAESDIGDVGVKEEVEDDTPSETRSAGLQVFLLVKERGELRGSGCS